MFKTSGEESLKLLSSQELYRLNDDGKWKKVNSNPVSMPYIEKPLLYKSSIRPMNLHLLILMVRKQVY